jgi:hypothetical protein
MTKTRKRTKKAACRDNSASWVRARLENAASAIMEAFLWHSTKEGHKYWARIQFRLHEMAKKAKR